MTELQTLKRNARVRGEKMLKKLKWKYDGLWWHNPRSGLRYTYEAAMDIEELRRSTINI